ncbi:MAG: hypothetical protein ACOYU3_02110 [Bacillota bacterium]
MPWYKRIFAGRYGVKRLSIVLFSLAGLSLVWALFIMPVYWRQSAPLFVALAFFLLGMWRCLSRNIERRAQEERAFDMLWERLRQQWRRLKQNLNMRKRPPKDANYIVIKCPRCRQKLRVPKGKGLIRITCKRCTEKFDRKV